jgi:pimeloyl-ACP methyl ester carboxylesterase
MGTELYVRRGGGGESVLLLLHGLGATGDVWRGWEPLLARRWPGRWLAPDLPGHGRSPYLSRYTFETLLLAACRDRQWLRSPVDGSSTKKNQNPETSWPPYR